MDQVAPVSRPGRDRYRDVLDVAFERRLQVEDAERRVPVFGFRDDVAAVRGRGERVTILDALDPGQCDD